MSWRTWLRGALPKRAAISSVAKPHVALTFDDGPHPDFTPRILDLLSQNGIKATFFLMGKNVEAHPEVARLIHEQGHELGNHSYSHPDLRQLEPPQIDEQLDRTDRLLQQIDGRSRHCFRAPWGYVNLKVLQRCWQRNQAAIHWSIDSLDYRKQGGKVITDRFAERPLGEGDIALWHDDNQDTLDALKILLPQWRQQGLNFATLSQAMGGR